MVVRLALAALLLATGLVQAASADALILDGRGELQRSLPRTQQATTLEFWAGVQVDEERAAYVKVLANDGNPVYRNGTVGGAGWWTEVGLLEGGVPRVVGRTNGSDLVELGVFRANETYSVWLRVHAPAGALSDSAELRLNYVVAVRAPVNEQSSGGTLNPSIVLQPHIVVESGVAAQARTSSFPSWMFPAIGLTSGSLLLVGLLILRRRRKNLEAEAESPEMP